MYENIPQELKQIDRWVCWRWEERFKDGIPDDPAKVPINPATGGRAMSNNPATWGTFQDAVEAAARGHIKETDILGIGFMFSGDGILGVDIDKCRNPETGEMAPEARDIITTLDSYTEFSQSGTGIHIICRGKLPDGKRRSGAVEMYETGRYFIMTGNVLDDAHSEVEDRTEQLAEVHKKHLAGKPKQQKKKSDAVPFESVTVDESEVMQRMSNSTKWSRIQQLLSGDYTGYPSPSEAEMGLMNDLYYYADGDAAVMESIFKKSAFYDRDAHQKNSHKFNHTFEKALTTSLGRTYSGDRAKQTRATNKTNYPDQPDIDMGLEQLVWDIDSKQSSKPDYSDTSSDLGRSKVFSVKFVGQVLWCGDIKSWLVWDEKRWNDDRVLSIMQLAKKMVEEMIQFAGMAISNATGEEEVKKAKAIFKDTVKAKSERSIKAMIELAKSDVSIKVEDLDNNPFLFNCQNGVVDLRTGELTKHDPSLMMTKIAGSNYVPGKEFELFDNFLKLIACDDTELIDYFQQICGMAAIGKVFHEGMAVFYGNGQNGKSTFLNCISKVFGDYACSINPEMLMSQRDGRQPVGITRLDGKRFVTAVELEEGRRMSSSMLKQLSSTDPITGRELYQKDRTFLPTHTLIMATNFLPKISSSDVGTWRRIAIVPFKATIQSKNQIKDYANVLFKKDGDAILTWIIEGAMKYIKNNYHIKLPSVVEAATKDYKAAEDWLGNFILECCETGIYKESGGDLYEAYVAWCERNNEHYKRRARDFAAALDMAGYNKTDTKQGAVWDGLRLIGKEDYSYSGKWKKQKYTQSAIPDDDFNPFFNEKS